MVHGHRGAEAVAVFATVLALAACGTEVDSPPTGTNSPVLPSTDLPSTDLAEETGESQTVTSPTPTEVVTAATSTVSATGSTQTATTTASETAGETSAEPGGTEAATSSVTVTATGTAGEAGATEEPVTLPGFAAPEDTLTQDASGEAQVMIDDVRLGMQDGYDRVVLDLSGKGAAGWMVRYEAQPALDGSGTPVDLSGEFVLAVTTRGMAYPEPGGSAYDPALLLVDGGDLSTVTEVLRSAPFEGQVPVFIGTAREAPFRVFELSDPQRLVIDIQH